MIFGASPVARAAASWARLLTTNFRSALAGAAPVTPVVAEPQPSPGARVWRPRSGWGAAAAGAAGIARAVATRAGSTKRALRMALSPGVGQLSVGLGVGQLRSLSATD